MFCRHKWEIVVDEITKSKIEHLMEIKWRPTGTFESMTTRKRIVILKCLVCGKIDKTIVNI